MYLSNHHKQNKELGLVILGNQPVMPGSVKGRGVKRSCNLPFGDYGFGLVVYKFRGLLYYVMLNLFQHLKNLALYLFSGNFPKGVDSTCRLNAKLFRFFGADIINVKLLFIPHTSHNPRRSL